MMYQGGFLQFRWLTHTVCLVMHESPSAGKFPPAAVELYCLAQGHFSRANVVQYQRKTPVLRLKQLKYHEILATVEWMNIEKPPWQFSNTQYTVVSMLFWKCQTILTGFPVRCVLWGNTRRKTRQQDASFFSVTFKNQHVDKRRSRI